jgi:hypothetical protein
VKTAALIGPNQESLIHNPQVLEKSRRKNEKTARQQGGLFFRENSSNGGKAIRTFWRNTMVGGMGCQGKIPAELSLLDSIRWQVNFLQEEDLRFLFYFAIRVENVL